MKRLLGLIVMLIALPGCIKYYELSESEFPQGKQLDDNRQVAAAYRRSVTIYDQFKTQAIFDGLWLSDTVRSTYVDIHASKRGVHGDGKEELLKRQLEENNHWLSFILLADIRDKLFASMSEPSATWTAHAVVDNVKLVAESVKEFDMDPEYQLLFGKTWSPFKTAYLVKFPLESVLAHKIAESGQHEVKLVISSMYKEAELEWKTGELSAKKEVLRDEDFYWC